MLLLHRLAVIFAPAGRRLSTDHSESVKDPPLRVPMRCRSTSRSRYGHRVSQRQQEIEALRQDARRFLAGEITAAALISRSFYDLAAEGPLTGVLAEFVQVADEWEPPGPSRVEATEELRRVCREILATDEV